jgi:hypothetical protein
LARYSPAMRSLLDALYNERRALFGCFVILIGATLLVASIMHVTSGNGIAPVLAKNGSNSLRGSLSGNLRTPYRARRRISRAGPLPPRAGTRPIGRTGGRLTGLAF